MTHDIEVSVNVVALIGFGEVLGKYSARSIPRRLMIAFAADTEVVVERNLLAGDTTKPGIYSSEVFEIVGFEEGSSAMLTDGKEVRTFLPLLRCIGRYQSEVDNLVRMRIDGIEHSHLIEGSLALSIVTKMHWRCGD